MTGLRVGIPAGYVMVIRKQIWSPSWYVGG